MALWQVKLPEWPYPTFSSIVPKEILVAYDGPITFTFLDADERLMLAHLCDEGSEGARFFVVPTSPSIVEQLKLGKVSLRGALEQPSGWLVDIVDGAAAKVFIARPSELPVGVLPKQQTLLHPSLVPILNVKAIGSTLSEDGAPLAAIRDLLSGVEIAWDRLIRHVGSKAKGLAEQMHNATLQATNIRFASIEVTLRSKQSADPVISPLVSDAEELLFKSLDWAKSSSTAPSDSLGEQRVILDVIKHLSPKRNASIERVEINGRYSSQSSEIYVLRKDDRRKAVRFLRVLDEKPPQLLRVEVRGTIGMSDDEGVFKLRNWSFISQLPENLAEADSLLGKELTFRFSPDEREKVAKAYEGQSPVFVIGEADPATPWLRLLKLSLMDSTLLSPENGDTVTPDLPASTEPLL